MTDNRYPSKIETTLTDFELDSLVLECFPVRRPLAIPSIKIKLVMPFLTHLFYV